MTFFSTKLKCGRFLISKLIRKTLYSPKLIFTTELRCGRFLISKLIRKTLYNPKLIFNTKLRCGRFFYFRPSYKKAWHIMMYKVYDRRALRVHFVHIYVPRHIFFTISRTVFILSYRIPFIISRTVFNLSHRISLQSPAPYFCTIKGLAYYDVPSV
jgi:hypothetical protein